MPKILTDYKPPFYFDGEVKIVCKFNWQVKKKSFNILVKWKTQCLTDKSDKVIRIQYVL